LRLVAFGLVIGYNLEFHCFCLRDLSVFNGQDNFTANSLINLRICGVYLFDNDVKIRTIYINQIYKKNTIEVT